LRNNYKKKKKKKKQEEEASAWIPYLPPDRGLCRL